MDFRRRPGSRPDDKRGTAVLSATDGASTKSANARLNLVGVDALSLIPSISPKLCQGKGQCVVALDP
jgi:hypothetical protein